MQFRLSDEISLAVEFEATSPHSLMVGIRQTMAGMLRGQHGRPGHPLMQLRARMAWVDRWIAERLARPNLTAALERDWKLQAATFRNQALREAGVNRTMSLHFLHEDAWHACDVDPTDEIEHEFRFDAVVSQEMCTDLWNAAQLIIRRIDSLRQLRVFVCEPVVYARPTHLQLVKRSGETGIPGGVDG